MFDAMPLFSDTIKHVGSPDYLEYSFHMIDIELYQGCFFFQLETFGTDEIGNS